MTTKIEWTEETWNPVTGCTKVSDGCKNCYAERIFPRIYSNDRVSVSERDADFSSAQDEKTGEWTRPRKFTDVVIHPERLDWPLHLRKPRRIFVNSMSDLFHEHLPFEFIADVFAVMSCTTRHTYQVLTKRPQRMLEWFRWAAESDNGMGPEVVQPIKVWPSWKQYRKGKQGGYDNCGPSWPCTNVYIGVSVENQETADARIPLLLQTPAAVRFVSYEPALDHVDFEYIDHQRGSLSYVDALRGMYFCDGLNEPRTTAKINWIIAGGESGPNARPSHPDWFRAVRDQCQAAGVPFFFKQWGNWLPEGQLNANGALCEAVYIFNDDEYPGTVHQWRPGLASVKVRYKKEIGRLLDGRTWDEYPTNN